MSVQIRFVCTLNIYTLNIVFLNELILEWLKGREVMDQVVVITGLAQGMGREVAKMLVARGGTVAGFDLDPAGIESLKAELDEIGGNHYLIP